MQNVRSGWYQRLFALVRGIKAADYRPYDKKDDRHRQEHQNIVDHVDCSPGLDGLGNIPAIALAAPERAEIELIAGHPYCRLVSALPTANRPSLLRLSVVVQPVLPRNVLEAAAAVPFAVPQSHVVTPLSTV
jgi:hypothetical protein